MSNEEIEQRSGEAVQVGDILDENMKRLKAAFEKSAAYWNSPEGKARHELEQKHEHERKVTQLRYGWNAPRRQLSNESIDRSGPWGEAFKKIVKKLGTGMLIGLCGNRGPGKTQIGVELMRLVTDKLRSAQYETAMGFFMQIKGTYRRDSERTEEGIIEDYVGVRLLVLDEIGKRGDTDWEDRLLCELIDRRYRDMRDTLLIANQDKGTFLTAIGPSIASRMQECGGIIECNWPSFRK